jgi:tRNA nucleotidyltransferase (CCA-adding enzyme)
VDPEKFSDDPLRALRLARFASKLGFKGEVQTLRLCARQDVAALPGERVRDELFGLLTGAHPANGLRHLAAMWSRDWFPELFAMMFTQQEAEWHPEICVWQHSIYVVEQLLALTDDPALLLAGLCHDIGKPVVTVRATEGRKAGRWIAHGHDEAGIEPATRLLARLAIDNGSRDRVLALVRAHLQPAEFYRIADRVGIGAFRRLAQRVDLDDLCKLARADMLGRPRGSDEAVRWFEERIKELVPTGKPPAPILLGRDLLALGLRPGPRIGELLKIVGERQLDGEVNTREEALALVASLLEGPRGG